VEALAAQGDELAAMDFTFLFDPDEGPVLHGFNVTERRRDPGFYDLLASEARLCSYVAIALGQVPQDHWFSLGRLLVASRGRARCSSRGAASMFEYLMPLLVMPNYEDTLLDHTCKRGRAPADRVRAVAAVPWGISESGYNRTDVHQNYQYRAFGVPGLGLKRGLAEDLVIAPYATAMALMVAPAEACENLQRLASEGRSGAYGFYEAVDYTPARLPPGESSVTIRSFMAHHQGMSLLALANLLRDSPMQRRFMACPLLRAADLLLQERVPKAAASVFERGFGLGDIADVVRRRRKRDARDHQSRRRPRRRFTSCPTAATTSSSAAPAAATADGATWRSPAGARTPRAIAGGRSSTCATWQTGDLWSAAHQPTLRATKGYEAIFTQARAEFRHSHGGLDIHTEISVSPEDDVELRRITITNRSSGRGSSS
jgi:cyclic beta-1,2-glucan synthetase